MWKSERKRERERERERWPFPQGLVHYKSIFHLLCKLQLQVHPSIESMTEEHAQKCLQLTSLEHSLHSLGIWASFEMLQQAFGYMQHKILLIEIKSFKSSIYKWGEKLGQFFIFFMLLSLVAVQYIWHVINILFQAMSHVNALQNEYLHRRSNMILHAKGWVYSHNHTDDDDVVEASN